MQPLTASQLAVLLGGSLITDGSIIAPKVKHITTDTRQCQPGSLFVALKGERFDAHAFIAQARQAGAGLALVEHPVADALPQIQVSSTRQALGQLGAWNRQQLQGPLVAVTGNSGKTTVKEMLAACLHQAFDPVLATPGNWNNDIGVPLTLLQLTSEHRAAVIEMGANHLGEIAGLAALARPEVGVITNVTGAHLGEFGSLEAIAQAKGELLPALAPDGLAVLNADDVFYSTWKARAPCPVLSFGLHQGEVCTESLQLDAQGCPHFVVRTPWGRQAFHLALPGLHNLANALAAIAVAGDLGVALADQAAALAALQPVPGRLQQLLAYADAKLLDDSYNASPGAVRSAIDLLVHQAGPTYLVLGALAELGEASEQLHGELGRYARAQGVDELLVVPGAAQAAAEAFGPAGQVFSDFSALAAYLKTRLTPDTWVLVKGSRSAGMERLVALLRKDASDKY